MKKIKNSQPQTKFTGSYKTKECSVSLLWLSNIMLNLLTKSSFDISLLFKLKHAAISLLLWTVNKPCYNGSLCLHEYTKVIGLKRKRHCLEGKS